MSVDHSWNVMLTTENPRTQGETYSSTTVSTTNPIWTSVRSSLSLQSDSAETNRLRHDTAISVGQSVIQRVSKTV